ncbi:hypothetical protein BGW36DRAFT_374780 [Talaromyces proteolyticus]|uniref:RanBP2-type domain-containing protein n=1 Tax=Talaromyces proteolyticus TaxID=1131652 RepID=A0AAD4Q2U0_9EURO|nr:uncharacterized protein BGW36DRAFT_374780 [Talaromyces proteolyticus]KAH8700688.1 hypothetical protein BGW36DRAFT_374780 [Talaromyces proteolyticus]
MPIDEARRLARTAAERRRTLSAGSGQKLGGTPLLKGTDVRRVIADAAQRRIDVTKGCASGSSESDELVEEASRNGFRTKAEEDDANERAIMEAYIEMIQEDERTKWGSLYVPPSQQNPAGPRGTVYPNAAPPVPVHSRPRRQLVSTTRTLSESEPNSGAKSSDIIDDIPWSCSVCTLENPPTYLCCDACSSERPTPSSLTAQSRLVTKPTTSHTRRDLSKSRSQSSSDVSSSRVLSLKKNALETVAALEQSRSKRPLGWLCHVCGAFMETEWWTCSACGTMKANS